MARIDLVDLAHSYNGNDGDPESYALKPVTMTWRQGGAYALLGPVRLRQDDAAQSDLRDRDAVARQDPVRRRRYHTAVNAEAQHRAGVPVSGDLRHHDGRTEPGVSAEEPRRAEGRDRRARRRDRAAARSHAGSRTQGDAADRRCQAEDLARTRPGALRRRRGAVRRAADRDRSRAEMAAALEAEGAASRARPDDDLRHPRPDRGADLCRHRRGDA